MRSLLLLVVIGVASASYVDNLFYRSNPTVREVVKAFKNGGMRVPAIHIEGMPFSYSVKIQRDFVTELGNHFKAILQNIISQVDAAIEAGHGISQLISAAEQIISAVHSIGGQVWEYVQTWLKELAEKVTGALAEFISNLLNTQKLLAKLSFGEVINSLVTWMTKNDTIQALIEYIQSIPTQLAEITANVLQILNYGDIAQLIVNIIHGKNSPRALGDIWNNITDFFEDLISNLPGQWESFTNWISSIWDSAVSTAEDKLEQLQIIAQQFINNAHDIGGTVAQQVLEFLKPYADHLGDLWDQAVEAAQSAISGGSEL